MAEPACKAGGAFAAQSEAFAETFADEKLLRLDEVCFIGSAGPCTLNITGRLR